jgi:hypothetical protein
MLCYDFAKNFCLNSCYTALTLATDKFVSEIIITIQKEQLVDNFSAYSSFIAGMKRPRKLSAFWRLRKDMSGECNIAFLSILACCI